MAQFRIVRKVFAHRVANMIYGGIKQKRSLSSPPCPAAHPEGSGTGLIRPLEFENRPLAKIHFLLTTIANKASMHKVLTLANHI